MPPIKERTTRHWTIHLISDTCADDVWSATNADVFDRDDYLTTLAELNVRGNRYNFAGANQTERFFKHASRAEAKALEQALREGRFHCTPIPNMLNCGVYTLATYPLLLEPYRKLCDRIGMGRALSRDAYHMESPTWTNGMVNLLSCAGFRSFTKTLLHYGAPWVDIMRSLPRLLKLEPAPLRSVFLLLGCGSYAEGNGALNNTNRFRPSKHGRHDPWEMQLEQDIIPMHAHLGATYPVNDIALIGCYNDLWPQTKTFAPIKVAAVGQVNQQANGYRVVNSTFSAFFDAVESQLGSPQQAPLRTVQGDTGSSWDIWPNTVQALWSQVRRHMRDVNSLLVLDAMAAPNARRSRLLDTAIHELVALGDHAWNGNIDSDMPGVKAANTAIRQRRLGALSKAIDAVRRSLLGGRATLKAGQNISVVNTLAWKRMCRVTLPAGLELRDERAGKTLHPEAGHVSITIPSLDAFESRHFQVVNAEALTEARPASSIMLPFKQMRPVLFIGDEEVMPAFDSQTNRWTVGPFQVMLTQHTAAGAEAQELVFDVQGEPPDSDYELCIRFNLPWKRCEWRGESGGGFVTPGPTDKGGDSLLGIAGSIFSVGEGLSAKPKRSNQRIDFAFDESGYCGLGRRTTLFARGLYNDAPDEQLMRDCVMRSTETEATLYWYLLSNQQNFREALLDQAGARQWRFRCGVRQVEGTFDDVDLYRFAAGFNREAEIASTEMAPARKAWLGVSPSTALVLGCRRYDDAIELDLYNVTRNSIRANMRGSLLQGKSIFHADMLGFDRRPIDRGGMKLAPLEFAKIIIKEEAAP
jgi:hypothetical protein